MQRTRLHILLASALAVFFTLFNVGLPIALYICPMMANNRCTCACTTPNTDGPVLTYVHTSCCSNSVLAERNTVPFLGTHKYAPLPSEVMFVLTSGSQWTPQDSHVSSFPAMTDTGPPPDDTPLYLLTSALLI